MHIQKKLKVLGSIAAVFLVAAIGIFLSLPSILSTKAGKEQAIHLINSQIPGTLTAESISLSWIGTQVFKGVKLKGLEGDTVLSFDSFTTETPLLRFLFSGPCIGKSELKNFFLNIIEEYPEVTNFQQALGNKKIQFKRKKDDVIIRLPLAEIALKSKKPRNFRKPEPIIFQNVDLLIDSSTFEKPIVVHAKGDTKQGSLLGNFEIDAKFLSGLAKRWHFNRKANVAVKANMTNFPVDMLDIALTLDQPELHGIVRDLMGDRITISVDQSLSHEDGSFLIKTESPTFNVNMIAGMEAGKYILRNVGTISFLITPELFDRIASRGRTTSLLRLANPAKTLLTIDDLAIPIDFDDAYPNALNIAGLSMHAKLDLQEANFTGSPFWGEVSIREVASTIEAVESSQTAVWRLRCEANQNGQHIPIKLDATIYKPKFGENFFESLKKQTNIHIQLAGVPLVALDQMFKTKPMIASLLGPQANVDLYIKNEPEKVKLNGSLWSDNKLAAIPRLDLNATLMENEWCFDIAGKTTKKGPVAGNLVMKEKKLAGSLSARHLTLVEASHGASCEFDSIALDWHSHDGCETVAYNLQAQAFSTPNKGRISLNGHLGKEASFALNMHEAPLSELTAFLAPEWKVHKKINALFGDRVNVAARHRGSDSLITLVIEGPNGKVAADGLLKDEMIYLNKPLEGEFTVTPLLGKKVLSDFVPIFRSVVSSESPITVKIEPEDFTCPTKTFDWEKVNISKGVVNLGKTQFQKEREIRGLLDLLETESEDTVQVWFTPTYFSMKEGVVHVDRFDMLFMQSYPLAAWGNVDMVKNRVKMTLGLTKEALTNAFRIDSLEDGFVMHLPIEGKLENASFNKSKAALSISNLISKSDPLLDTLFTFSGLGKGKTPHPTTSPFPWNEKS